MVGVPSLICLAIALIMMGVICVVDARTKSIPDAFTAVLAIAALGYHYFLQDIEWTGALLGVAFFGLQWGLSRGKWVGSGDVLLAIALGILVGSWRHMAIALMVSYAVGALLVSVLIGLGKLSRSEEIAFGPFLVVGAFVAFFTGEKILSVLLPVA